MAWAPDYATLAEGREYVTRTVDTVDDTSLALAITASSRAVDLHTNRQFGVVSAAVERVYTARWDRRRCRWVVDIDDLMTTSNLTVTTTELGLEITGYTLEDVNAAADGRPWTRLVVDADSVVSPGSAVNGVTIDAVWGWTAVPTPVKNATLLQTSRLFTRRNAPFGIAGSPESGSEMRLLARVDPDVAVTLGPYVRWWAAA
jgi:hypothetical protein